MSLLIRYATEDDASVAVEVLRRSISELCHEDHRDDPARLSSWLANKNVATWKLWLNQPEAFVLVAEEYGSLCGVGMATWDGQILLNYVHPDARFRGVSTAILGALEKDAAARGADHASLESTRTARDFYLSRGYTLVASAMGSTCGKHFLLSSDTLEAAWLRTIRLDRARHPRRNARAATVK